MPPFLKNIFNECNDLLMFPIRSVGKQNVPLDEKVQTPRGFTKEWNAEPDKALDPVSSIKQRTEGVENHTVSPCVEKPTV